MKRPKRVLRFFALSVIFFSIIQAQNSRANENESERDRLLREATAHEVAAKQHLTIAHMHSSLALEHTAHRDACLVALSNLGSIPNRTILRIQDYSASFLKNAHIGTRVSTTMRDKNGETSVGAVFQRVKFNGFKVAWQRIFANGSRGLVWSELIGIFTNDNRNGKKSQAEEECEKRGGRLPSIDEFESLKQDFDLDENGLLSKWGKIELHRLFPDMKGRWFWSSSPSPGYPARRALVFYGGGGNVGSHFRDRTSSVLCVWP